MLTLGRLGAGHLPVFFAIIFTINLGSTYVFAVYHGDVDPVFPYISAAGNDRPESCFFSLLMNISASLSILIIYLRYSLIKELIRGSDKVIEHANKWSLLFGVAGGMGMMVVANFQESAVIKIHLGAAVTCFGSGGVYMMIQTFITMRMHPLYNNRRIGYIRLGLAAWSVITFTMALTFGTLAASEFHKVYPDLPTPRPWNRKVWMPGYNLHIVSAVSEWLMAVAHVSYILSFSREFEKIRANLKVESLVVHLDNSPLWRSTEDLERYGF
ncbi:unnamed protein product, partial [Mesorhabditis belari]|uniref:DNA damage-regulated autophagy modulator protein 2 n=1 Tax=Mesorhabditis belari TaxID=2138241 RepID=A0AAF3F3Y5_9BILA